MWSSHPARNLPLTTVNTSRLKLGSQIAALEDALVPKVLQLSARQLDSCSAGFLYFVLYPERNYTWDSNANPKHTNRDPTLARNVRFPKSQELPLVL